MNKPNQMEIEIIMLKRFTRDSFSCIRFHYSRNDSQCSTSPRRRTRDVWAVLWVPVMWPASGHKLWRGWLLITQRMERMRKWHSKSKSIMWNWWNGFELCFYDLPFRMPWIDILVISNSLLDDSYCISQIL